MHCPFLRLAKRLACLFRRWNPALTIPPRNFWYIFKKNYSHSDLPFLLSRRTEIQEPSFHRASLASPGVTLKGCSSRIQFDNMYMKYSLFLPSLSASIFASYCRLRACLSVAACVWYWQRLSGRCVSLCVSLCVWHRGITQMSILLDSCLLPSDASHLRRRRRRPSKPSACLSLLIDLSLDGGVWECFRENMYFDRFSAPECVPCIRKGGAFD